MMNETLAYRVGRLVSGGFHAMLDKAEDLAPEVALNENIREIERAIDDVRAELGKTLAQKHLATKKMADENTKYEALSDSIATAVAMGRDELATVGISEQMDIEARLPVLEHTIADCVAKEQELGEFIEALQAKRREMQQALKDLQSVKSQSEPAISGLSKTEQIAQRANKSSHAFDRLMHRQTGLDMSGTDAKKLASLQELENLSRNNRIAERLAKLKADKS